MIWFFDYVLKVDKMVWIDEIVDVFYLRNCLDISKIILMVFVLVLFMYMYVCFIFKKKFWWYFILIFLINICCIIIILLWNYLFIVIGDYMYCGLSGGEKKWVNIVCEFFIDFNIMLIDVCIFINIIYLLIGI